LNEGDNVLMLGFADICVMLPQGEAEQQYRLVITSMEESGEAEEEEEEDTTLTKTISFEHTYSGIPFLQINTTQYMTGTTSMTSVEEKVEVSSSLKGVQYCAESGSVLKFDADNPMLEVAISVEKLSPTECCVKQPVFRHSSNNNNDGVDKIMKCPATVSKEPTDSVCWSTSHYSLRADSLQYSIADTAVVVDWKDRTVFEEEKCILPSNKNYPVLSDGVPTVPLATKVGVTISTGDTC
jgi:hypothetical protein